MKSPANIEFKLAAIGGLLITVIFSVYMESIVGIGFWILTMLMMAVASCRLWRCRRWALLVCIGIGWWQVLSDITSPWPLKLGWVAWSTALTILALQYWQDLEEGI